MCVLIDGWGESGLCGPVWVLGAGRLPGNCSRLPTNTRAVQCACVWLGPVRVVVARSER